MFSIDLSYYNPVADASLAVEESVPTHETEFFHKNLKAAEAAEDQYSEITEKQRLQSVELATKM